MQVQKIQTEQQTKAQMPQFKGVPDIVLRYLATNQAVGANAVDLCSMVIPRTASDAIRRGPAAGLETGRREAMGTVNDTSIGLYGMAAASMAGATMGLEKKYGDKIDKATNSSKNTLKMNKLLTAPETLNVLAENKARQIKNNGTQLDYLKETLRNVRVFNPGHIRADKEGYISISESVVEKVAKALDEAINDKSIGYKIYHEASDGREAILNLITEDTGTQTKYILKSLEKGGKDSVTDLKRLLGDIYMTSKSFNTEKVQDAFKEQIKNGQGIKDNAFIKSMNKFIRTKSGIGFAFAAAVGMSVQPINMYLTKKKTGSDGFVGVEGRKKNDTFGFKMLKVVTALAGMTGVLASMKCNLKKPLKLPKEFIDKIAFNGFWPTIPQLMGVYGVTIMSRILSTRDGDELRESVTKDSLGFVSWLILGDIVNRAVAEKMDKSVMSRTKEMGQQGFWKRVFNSKLKTRDEVLIDELKKNGIGATKEVNGKLTAKTFKEMLKDLDGIADKKIVDAVKKKLKVLNKAQIAGYLCSGLVLGLGIPNLNIAITNALDKKRKAKVAEQEVKPQQV